MRRQRARPHGAEPKGPGPRGPRANPQRPLVTGGTWGAVAEGGLAHARAGYQSHTPRARLQPLHGGTSAGGHGTLLGGDFPVRESASPRKPFPLPSAF